MPFERSQKGQCAPPKSIPKFKFVTFTVAIWRSWLLPVAKCHGKFDAWLHASAKVFQATGYWETVGDVYYERPLGLAV